MEQALNEVRFQGALRTKVFAYSEKRRVEDIPPESETGRPTIFQVFGRLHPTEDYVIS